MPRFVLVGLMALFLAAASPASAAPVTAWHAHLARAGISGTVTVSITNAAAGGTLVMDVRGLTPRTLSDLWLRGGSCSATRYGVTHVRWTVPANGHLVLTVPLAPAWAGYFLYDMAHRGGAHATLTDGSRQACAMLVVGR